MPRLMQQVRVACMNTDITTHLVDIAVPDVLACVCNSLREEGVMASFVGCDVMCKAEWIPKSVYINFAVVVEGKYHTYSDSKTCDQFKKGTVKDAGWLREGSLWTQLLDEVQAREHLGIGLPVELEQSIGKLVRQELSQMAAEALEAGERRASPRTRQRRL